jgi:hypothetical protein
MSGGKLSRISRHSKTNMKATETTPKKPKAKSFASQELHRLRRDFPLLVELCRFERETNRDYFHAGEGVIFRLPLPPNMANARLHWRSKDNLRRVYLSQCNDLITQHLLPRPPAVPLACARLHVTLCVKREHDHDNAVARCKFACDFLQSAGYIESDKPKFLEWAGLPKQIVNTRALPRLIFVLAD